MQATYSPDDNKLRLYTVQRLGAEEYARVKAAGFRWAPKQELFVAPAWNPERADLLIELCGSIGDEDTSLVERAEERSGRFEDYSDRCKSDAQNAQRAVSAITENIPLGQPILVGHHSERHARRDAKRIETGMRRAVQNWELSAYWRNRAAGAVRAAKYKELPAVRARRIKGLETDQRREEKRAKEARIWLKMWQADGFTRERAITLANHDDVSQCFPLDKYPRELPASQYEGQMSIWDALTGGIIDEHTAREIAVNSNQRCIASAERWLAHIAFRLEYDRAMLAEHGGTVADRTKPEKGGAVRCWASRRGGWSYVQKVNRVSVTVLDNWGNRGPNFTRTIPFDKLEGLMSAADVQAAREAGRLVEASDKTGFFLAETSPALQEDPPTVPATKASPEDEIDREKIQAMKSSLAAGVQVVSAPQLFPTPRDLARRLVELADVQPGQRVLEPSAGTGNLIRAVFDAFTGADCGQVVAVEVNQALVAGLEQQRSKTAYATEANFEIHAKDFLTVNGELGTFDRIVMNPPFSKGADIAHIEHARRLLKPGGRLVALCANGPRQQARLKGEAAEWYDMPADSFKSEGTGVNVALCVFDGPANDAK